MPIKELAPASCGSDWGAALFQLEAYSVTMWAEIGFKARLVVSTGREWFDQMVSALKLEKEQLGKPDLSFSHLGWFREPQVSYWGGTLPTALNGTGVFHVSGHVMQPHDGSSAVQGEGAILHQSRVHVKPSASCWFVKSLVSPKDYA